MLFLMSSLSAYVFLFMLLALGPAVALMVYVYQLDTLDREPIGLLWSLVMRDVVAALFASLLEASGMRAFGLLSGLDPSGMRVEISCSSVRRVSPCLGCLVRAYVRRGHVASLRLQSEISATALINFRCVLRSCLTPSKIAI